MPIFKEVYEPGVAQGTNMADYAKTFPETQAAPMSPEGSVPFLPSSESVGCGHMDGDHLAPFSTEEFPNTETGEGSDGMGGASNGGGF